MTGKYHIRGTLIFEEYLECHKVLAARRRLWLRGIMITFGAAMLIHGLANAAYLPDAAIGAAFVLYGVVISPIQFRHRVKRNWDRYPKIREEFDITISAEGIDSADARGNPAHTDWGSFFQFRESPCLFLLYLSPLLPLCIPKRLVPETDREGLRALLSSAIANNKTNSGQNAGGEP